MDNTDEPMDDQFYTEEPTNMSPILSQSSLASLQPCSPRMSQGSNASQASRALFPGVGREYHLINDASRYPLRLERYFHEHDLMVPKDKDLDSIEAHEKSWGMVRPVHYAVTDGISWSFVDACGGLSSELIKVCHFFDIMNGLSQHHPWTGMAVPTSDISQSGQPRHLRLKYSKNDVVGVTDSRYVENEHDVPLGSADRRGVDTGRLLYASELNSSGTQHTAMPLFKIQTGFTAAFFKADAPNPDEDAAAEALQTTFGVVTVTSLRNVDALKLIVDRLLAPPAARTSNFQHVSKRQRDLLELFEHILIYQAYGVLNDDSGQRPSQFFANPSGRLGIDTLCNTALEPIKMCKLLEKNHTNPREICIVGYPQINWQADPDSPGDLKNYLQYSAGRLAHQVGARSQLTEACHKLYDEEKKGGRRRKAEEEEEPPEEFSTTALFGWPVRVQTGVYCQHLSCLCPILMDLRRLSHTDVDESLQCWTLNLGAIPPLALCLIRGCMLFDPSSPGTMRLDSILLRELDVPGNLQLIRQRFYSSSSFSHRHIAMQGCQEGNYVDILNHIHRSVESGSMSACTAVHLLRKAVEYGTNVFVNMVESNSFLSARLTQSMDLMKKLAHEERMGRANFCRGMKTYQRILLQLPGLAVPSEQLWQRAKGSPHYPALLNPYDRARRTLLLCLVDANRFYRLNSGNLQLMLEIMISMIAHTIGGKNKTHEMFGRGLEIAPCCGTLSEWVQVAQKRIRVRNTANPNSAGKDFTCNKITNLFTIFCQKYGIHDSMQGLTVIKRFTPVAMESFTTLQMSQGKIVGIPDEELNMLFYIMTEARDAADLRTLITVVYRRGEQQRDCSITTGEDSKKNRHAVTKVQVSPVMLCTRCGNKKPESLAENEQVNTISAVVAMLECGSRIYVPGMQEGEFGDVETDINEVRSSPFEGDTERYAKEMLAGTHLHCTTWLGIPNFVHTFGAEINPVVLSVIDWIFFYSQRHMDSLLHPLCRGNNWLRLRRVYESRAVAFTAWVKMFQFLTDCRDRPRAIQRAMCSFQADALALTDVVGMVWSFLRRTMHWGPILYASCFIRECNMPLVPIAALAQLLRMDQPPAAGPLRGWYDRIVHWLVDCVAEHRFCPADEMTYSGDYCEYISSAGLPDGSVEINGILRVNQPTNAWRDVPAALAEALWGAFGEELHHGCSVTKESMLCALEDMLSDFSVELQKLFAVNMFDMQRHLGFFGLRDRLNWRCKDRNGKHPFMVKACWPKGPGETASIGGGLHVIQLLMLGSLLGDVSALHPKMISGLCMSLIRQLLFFAPAGIVPGNYAELRTFDCYTGSLVPFVLEEGHMRTESFIRPCDLAFAEKGDLTFCKNIGNFAVEDVLHMGPLCELALRIGCKVYEIPATAEVNYFPRPKKAYCVYDPLRGLTGYIVFSGESIYLEAQERPSDVELSRIVQMQLLSWQDEMAALGFIMLPMVWRSGACVAVTEGEGLLVGCLVPADDMDDEASDGNFCLTHMCYTALVRVGETVRVPLLTMLQTLLPIGQRLYLKMESQSAGPLLRRLRAAVVPEQNALRVHLFTPTSSLPARGKVYVACKKGRGDGRVGGALTLVVDPWELMLEVGERNLLTEVPE